MTAGTMERALRGARLEIADIVALLEADDRG